MGFVTPGSRTQHKAFFSKTSGHHHGVVVEMTMDHEGLNGVVGPIVLL